MISSVRLCSLLIFALLLSGGPDGALALPMQPEACERARSEQAELNASGTAEDVARGGAWGRDNLAPDRLKKVARWIELEEQILFRCPRPKPTPQTAGAGPAGKPQDGADRSEDGEAPADATAGAKPATGQKKKSAAKTASEEGGQLAPADGGGINPPGPGPDQVKPEKPKVKPPSQAQAKPKPKVNDAYMPPVMSGGEEYHNPTPGPAPSGGSGSALAP